MSARSIKKVEEPQGSTHEIDAQNTARVVESLVLRGDISALSPEERAKFYVGLCEQLGLNPATQPFAMLRLNGKEVMYPTRGATDQLAAIHRLNREIIDGPKVVDLAGTKLVYAVCRVTHPNGRVETAVGTVPLTDPVNVLMKCETKAKRRATLSILGLGMLDETEVEAIPAHVKSPGDPIHLGDVTPRGPAAQTEEPVHEPTEARAFPEGLRAFMADVAKVELPGESVLVWMKHRAHFSTLAPADRESGWKELCARTEDVGKMKNAKVWLKRAIAEEDARRQSTPQGETSLETEGGGADDEGEGGDHPPTLVQFNEQISTLRTAHQCVTLWANQELGLARIGATQPAWRELTRKAIEMLTTPEAPSWNAASAGDWIKRELAKRAGQTPVPAHVAT